MGTLMASLRFTEDSPRPHLRFLAHSLAIPQVSSCSPPRVPALPSQVSPAGHQGLLCSSPTVRKRSAWCSAVFLQRPAQGSPIDDARFSQGSLVAALRFPHNYPRIPLALLLDFREMCRAFTKCSFTGPHQFPEDPPRAPPEVLWRSAVIHLRFT